MRAQPRRQPLHRRRPGRGRDQRMERTTDHADAGLDGAPPRRAPSSPSLFVPPECHSTHRG